MTNKDGPVHHPPCIWSTWPKYTSNWPIYYQVVHQIKCLYINTIKINVANRSVGS